MKESVYEKLIARRPELKLRSDEPLSAHTTFRIGGPADVFAEVQSAEELAWLIAWCRQEEVPFFILGRGSNLLVSDEGFRGVILHLGAAFSEVEIAGSTVKAGCGITLASLAQKILKAELAGFEFAAGIPGSLGGAVYMNAGAYGGEMKDILTEVTALQPDGKTIRIPAAELKMGYRDSRFQHEDLIILSAEMELTPGTKEEITARMQDLMERRTSRQPLEWPSAGSVFKRPEGHFAGGLIEEAGLKGCRIGGAEVSPKHAGFIVNAGGATAADVVALIRHIQDTVEQRSGVRLEPEMRILIQEQLIGL